MQHDSPQIKAFKISADEALGYACDEVDDFFTLLADHYEILRQGGNQQGVLSSLDIRTKTFTGQKKGYLPADVDAALDKVEDQFARYERLSFINQQGSAVWEESLEADAALIMGRLKREAGQRFRRPSSSLTKGYYVGDVDALCQALIEHLRGPGKLSPALIRQASFRSATGDMAYEETQVDAFLDRAIALLVDLG